MRPTSIEIIESVVEALDGAVLPAVVDDRWTASTVRSAITLLQHLAKRVELEPAFLRDDNEDARHVLAQVLTTMRPGADAGLRAEIEAALADPAGPLLDVVAMDEINMRYQAVFDRLLRDQYAGAWAGAEAQPVRAAIRAYLDRRLERERDIYFPAFQGPPF